MITIKNINEIVGWEMDLSYNDDVPGYYTYWKCTETIEFPDDTIMDNENQYYRFEFENGNADFPLCIYLQRENDVVGNYSFENNLTETKLSIQKEGIKELYIFKIAIEGYIASVLIDWENNKK